MTLNPGVLLGLASLFTFACVESPKSQADCGDALVSDTDFGVDASEFDVAADHDWHASVPRGV